VPLLPGVELPTHNAIDEVMGDLLQKLSTRPFISICANGLFSQDQNAKQKVSIKANFFML